MANYPEFSTQSILVTLLKNVKLHVTSYLSIYQKHID